MEDSAFAYYYHNAVINSIIIMDDKGIVIEVNKAFTNNFGYTTNDLKGKNFETIFTNADKRKEKPAIELENTLKNGQSADEGFLLHKNGEAIWCSGEVILSFTSQQEKILIKDVINLQARKHLNHFLNNTEELLDRVFHSSGNVPMMILNAHLKIDSVNDAFIKYFDLKETPVNGSALSDIAHPFWKQPDIRKDLVNVVVTNSSFAAQPYTVKSTTGNEQTILVSTKIIFSSHQRGRRIFVLIEEEKTD